MVVEAVNHTTSAIVNIDKVVIVGTGLMGTGIAQVAVESGVRVTMVGRTEEKCEAARAKISAGVNKTAKRKFAAETVEQQQAFVVASMEKLNFVTDLFSAGLEETDMIVEAVVENLKVKQKLFTDVESRVPR